MLNAYLSPYFAGQGDEIRLYFQGIEQPDRFYTGMTDDVEARLNKHNAGHVYHTAKYRPWRLKTYIAFSDEQAAIAFEKYLKSPSGRVFAKKRL